MSRQLSIAAPVRERMGQRIVAVFTLPLLLASLAACTKNETRQWDNSKPMVVAVKTTEIAEPSAAALRLSSLKRERTLSAAGKSGVIAAREFAESAAAPAIEGQVTFAKSEILGREFLYGSDLQYSSIAEDDLMLQTIALGHVIAKFRVLGDRLQLVADQTHLFESDINRPERLLQEFPIVSQDATSVTVTVRSASPILASVLGGAKAPAPRTTWVRSIDYVQQGNYLLVETSVEQADGTIAEFMESVFPRQTLTEKAPPPILANPDLEPLAKRYRFISGDDVWMSVAGERQKTKIANRFPVGKSGGVIEWYATSNTPNEYLPVIVAGVEGWNRYSQKMWGRDFIKFKGILPAGVKVGDPRYNVINWDSVPKAGAAYESQAADPLTGLQSHSLVYLPYAWIKMGLEYWNNSSNTQDEDAKADLKRIFTRGDFAGSPLRVRCMHDLELAASLEARRSPEAFAKELLKQVLFHEIGHALGLDHNFKGSLSYDPEAPSPIFSTSIMDYNQYQLEDLAYDGLDSSTGPLLEYDRQIVSALYNEGNDVSKSDPVVPVCNDEEADATEGGVDPLCVRYDAGQDPTVELLRTVRLVKDPNYKSGRTKSLALAIRDTGSALGNPSEVTTEVALNEKLNKLVTELMGTTQFYYARGAQGLAYMTQANLKSLYVFQDSILPAAYDASQMRTRVNEALGYVLNTTSLEAPVRLAFTDLGKATMEWVKATPYVSGLPSGSKDTVVSKLEAKFTALPGAIEKATFPRLRSAVLTGLVVKEGAPFFFDATTGTDYENVALEILEATVTKPGLDSTNLAERAAAAQSLLSFKDIPEGSEAIDRAVEKIKEELPLAKSAKERDALRKLLKALQE